MKLIRLLIVALACVTPVAGFSPMTPYRHVVAQFASFVVIDPYQSPEKITAYQATVDGFKQLWQSRGWYGYPDEVFLSADGMSLVRIRKLVDTSDSSKMGEQSVLFIYFKGKLVKEYKLSELVSEMGLIRDRGHHRISRWTEEAAIVPTRDHHIDTDRKDERSGMEPVHSYNYFTFGLITLEKKELFFDLLDGKRIDKKQIAPGDENMDTSDHSFKNQKSEQDGAEQPATAPELKSEGKDKPQPESKVAPR